MRGAPVHMTSPIFVLIDERIERLSIEHAGECGECRCIRGKTDHFPPLPTQLRNNNSRSTSALQETNDSLIVVVSANLLRRLYCQRGG